MGHGYNTTWTHGTAIICIKFTVLLESILIAGFRQLEVESMDITWDMDTTQHGHMALL